MYKFVMMIIVSFIVAGCASAPKGWIKDGVTKDDTKTAMAKCQYDISMNKITKEEQAKVFTACLEKEGYRYYR